MKQKAFIFDIDGTLSDPKGRLHFVTNGSRNWDAFLSACADDAVHEDIRTMAWDLSVRGYKILLVTGRNAKYAPETIQWLQKHKVSYDALLMRAAGDSRQDFLIKEEIYHNAIEPYYEVLGVFDDRPSVVAMWRRLGLRVYHVNDGFQEGSTLPRRATLHILIGPSGSGKTTYAYRKFNGLGEAKSVILSSDEIRSLALGSEQDQTQNDLVFKTLHKLAQTYLDAGITVTLDATHLRRKDRLAAVALARDFHKVEYHVISRPLESIQATRGTRGDWVERHYNTFKSQYNDIIKGDDLPHVKVNLIGEPLQ